MNVTASCIYEIHCLAIDGFDLSTVHKLSRKEKVQSCGVGIRTQGCWLGSRNASCVLCRPPTSKKLVNTITFIVLQDFYHTRAVRQRRHPKLQLQNVSILLLLFIILAQHLNFKIKSLNATTNRFEYLTQFITVRLQVVILYWILRHTHCWPLTVWGHGIFAPFWHWLGFFNRCTTFQAALVFSLQCFLKVFGVLSAKRLPPARMLKKS